MESIKNKLKEIIDTFFDSSDFLSYDDKLHVILSESSQALELVTIIEDEFNIEFEDDDIDLNFFMSLEVMAERIKFLLPLV